MVPPLVISPFLVTYRSGLHFHLSPVSRLAAKIFFPEFSRLEPQKGAPKAKQPLHSCSLVPFFSFLCPVARHVSAVCKWQPRTFPFFPLRKRLFKHSLQFLGQFLFRGSAIFAIPVSGSFPSLVVLPHTATVGGGFPIPLLMAALMVICMAYRNLRHAGPAARFFSFFSGRFYQRTWPHGVSKVSLPAITLFGAGPCGKRLVVTTAIFIFFPAPNPSALANPFFLTALLFSIWFPGPFSVPTS